MSLREIHIIFIISSILLTLGFAVWAMNLYVQTHFAGYLITGILSVLSSIGLSIYCVYVKNKLKASNGF